MGVHFLVQVVTDAPSALIFFINLYLNILVGSVQISFLLRKTEIVNEIIINTSASFV